MTYFRASIFKTRTKVINGNYHYFILHLPLRKRFCTEGAVLTVCKLSDLPALVAGSKDAVLNILNCLGTDSSNCTEVRPSVYRRRKKTANGYYMVEECRIPLSMYVRMHHVQRYGTNFLVYYDKEVPLIIAFPASPLFSPPDCFTRPILNALERPSTIVRSFTPEQLASILLH